MRKKAIKLRKVLSLVLAFALLAGMLPMEWSTFVAKAADSYELVENAEVNDLLYFVDAGDYNTSTGPEGLSSRRSREASSVFFIRIKLLSTVYPRAVPRCV